MAKPIYRAQAGRVTGSRQHLISPMGDDEKMTPKQGIKQSTPTKEQ